MYFFPYGKKGCAIDSVGSHPRFLRRMTPSAWRRRRGTGFWRSEGFIVSQPTSSSRTALSSKPYPLNMPSRPLRRSSSPRKNVAGALDFSRSCSYGEMGRQIIRHIKFMAFIGAFDSTFGFCVRKSYLKRVEGGYR